MAISKREEADRRSTHNQNLIERLQKVVLGWNYWALQGGGMFDTPVVPDLEELPAYFTDVEVES
jgi:hypothetical protein